MPLFRSKAEQKLVERGLDPARLPPGQYLTEKWPVLHAGTVPATDLGSWDFRVFGEVENELVLDGKVVGRITSRADGRALGYVRTEVPEDAVLEVGGASARLH